MTVSNIKSFEFQSYDLHDWELLSPLPNKGKSTNPSGFPSSPIIQLSLPHSTSTKTIAQLAKSTCCGVHRPWGERLISKEHAFQKMEKNLYKAWKEHVAAFKNQFQDNKISHPYTYPQPKTLIKTDEKLTDERHRTQSALFHVSISDLNSGHAECRGKRSTMEDAHFYLPLKNGLLIGVLDGHSGRKVTDFATSRIQKLFPWYLDKNDGNVHQALEEMFFIVQEEIILNDEFNGMGSTAVISYIDISTNIIYTATLGDSEANIYRKIGDDFKSIPLSCIRNWASRRDEWRASIATENEYQMPVQIFWKGKANEVPAKHRRIAKRSNLLLKNDEYGINVGRVFGDQEYNLNRPINVTSAKPKITYTYIEPGDVLILACDGLKDFVNENAIVQCIEKLIAQSPKKISQALVDLAFHYKTKDNVTVLTVKIQ